MSAVNVSFGDRSEADSMTVEVDFYDLEGQFTESDIFLTVGPANNEEAQQVAVLDPETAEKIGWSLLSAATEKRVADFKRALA